ncbi:MAG: hypothetical protein A3K03_10870 [Bdellovibrionales bacterium RIFOXYD1_FULL_44_7]|nr:MAG: hypothetical protein A3K03_10870 [Bdellovibrionales bacterium RIFOXYD1_FULL_44_7]
MGAGVGFIVRVGVGIGVGDGDGLEVDVGAAVDGLKVTDDAPSLQLAPVINKVCIRTAASVTTILTFDIYPPPVPIRLYTSNVLQL